MLIAGRFGALVFRLIVLCAASDCYFRLYIGTETTDKPDVETASKYGCTRTVQIILATV